MHLKGLRQERAIADVSARESHVIGIFKRWLQWWRIPRVLKGANAGSRRKAAIFMCEVIWELAGGRVGTLGEGVGAGTMGLSTGKGQWPHSGLQ